jgi:uncharacterized lipoprotein
VKPILIILCTTVLLTACSSRYATNAEHEYTHSKNGPQLITPQPLTQNMISHFYDLPEPTTTAEVDIRPPVATRDLG